ncbi:MAG: hypothetical protein H0V29_05845 [Thermoleophilaceae bacterium]|nr:hypothetical protein [Thermoleophilaceae bacterium]
MKTALTAALALLALAAPAHAESDLGPLVEACEENAPSAAMCTGLAKLGERASAECRRLGVLTDDMCWSQVGRRVLREEVGEYRASQTHRALAFQYDLAGELPLRNTPWIGTHNSFNSPSEMPTVSHTDSNQQLSLTEQLDVDVRSLELDIHWFPTLAAKGQGPVVCHARPKSEGHVGCTTERLLGEVLGDIDTWLAKPANKDQVILLYLEDAIQDGAGYTETKRLLDEKLGNRVMKPSGNSPGRDCAGLPINSLSRDDVRKAGKQVVLVGNCNTGWGSHVYGWDREHDESPNADDFSAFPACDSNDTREATYDSKIMRVFEDSTWIARAPDPTRAPDRGQPMTTASVGHMARCGVDLLGMDQLLPKDGRLEALVWSFAPGEEPALAAGTCTKQRADGRWVKDSCTAKQRAACVKDGAYSLTPQAVTFEDAKDACAAAGATFALPRTGHENSRLRAAAGSDAAWLDHGKPASPVVEPPDRDPVTPPVEVPAAGADAPAAGAETPAAVQVPRAGSPQPVAKTKPKAKSKKKAKAKKRAKKKRRGKRRSRR